MLLTSSLVLADQAGGSAPGGERYGWAGTQQVRTTYAVRNPDSLTLFALANTLTPYYWYTGVAQSQSTVYQYLQVNNPHTIQNLQLKP